MTAARDAAAEEFRPETCPDCGAVRERAWLVQFIRAGGPLPQGWRRSRGRGGRRTMWRPTRFVTLCLCDT